MRTRATRVGVSIAGWLFLALAVVVLWPSQLGGCTGFIIINGHSMEPTFTPGDLVITECISSPEVGQVVTYTPIPGERELIIHRIVGGTSEGWILQGDNNDWTDPFAPTNDDVRGTLLFSIPNVGKVFQVLASPYAWIPLLILACAVAMWPRSVEDDENEDQDDEVEAGLNDVKVGVAAGEVGPNDDGAGIDGSAAAGEGVRTDAEVGEP